MAASSANCGARPVRTCLAEGGAPVLKSRISSRAVGALVDAVGAGRETEGPGRRGEIVAPADLGMTGGDAGVARRLPGDEPAGDGAEAGPPEGMHIGELARSRREHRLGDIEQPALGARIERPGPLLR